jgi:hypothetical protein
VCVLLWWKRSVAARARSPTIWHHGDRSLGTGRPFRSVWETDDTLMEAAIKRSRAWGEMR